MKVTPTKKNAQFINCCPHDVVVYSGASKIKNRTNKYRGGTKVLCIAPSGTLASVYSEVESVAPIDICGVSVPTYSRRISGIKELPNSGNYYIVSQQYLEKCVLQKMDTSHLLVPYGVVLDEEDHKIGCVGFTRA